MPIDPSSLYPPPRPSGLGLGMSSATNGQIVTQGLGLRQHGTTLLEVLIVVAIVAVLSAVAIPSWRNSAIQQDLASDTRQLRQALSLARSTAIMTQLTVVLCPSRDGKQCSDDWSAPLILREDQSSEVLRRFPASRNQRLSFRRDGRPVRFRPSGRASGHNGTFLICAENDSGRKVVLSNFGRVREQPARGSSCAQGGGQR